MGRKSYHEDSYLETCHDTGREYNPDKHVARQMKDQSEADARRSSGGKTSDALTAVSKAMDWLMK